MRITLTQVHLAILFAIVFISIGWVAPLTYATYAPDDRFIEVNEFSAQNATLADDSHQVCFDRDVKAGTSAQLFTELYLVSGNDTLTRVDSKTIDTYLRQGDTTVRMNFDLPDNVRIGEHKYLLVVKMDLANERIVREFQFESEPFQIAENATDGNTPMC